MSGQDRIKSDQRILGGSKFIQDVLSESKENFTRKYKLKSRGFNFEKVVDRVSLLFRLEKDYITGKGRQKNRVQARDLVCYWSVIELGISMADLAKRLGLTVSAVSYAVKRGEEIAKEGDYLLED
ncbi:MAG: winged helix-turn-helix transcriptional regulator [Deltaproteobacteria bacterium]|nr:winged helix-turn-helix transcriptional regulator [Deltaproteobacteria bacterium]